MVRKANSLANTKPDRGAHVTLAELVQRIHQEKARPKVGKKISSTKMP